MSASNNILMVNPYADKFHDFAYTCLESAFRNCDPE